MKRDGTSSKREIELGKARKAGYEGDKRTLTRSLVERQTASYASLMDAYRAGERMRVRADQEIEQRDAAGTMELALGRILRLGSRPEQVGDVEQYEAARLAFLAALAAHDDARGA